MFILIKKLCHSGLTLMASLQKLAGKATLALYSYSGLESYSQPYTINMNLQLSQTKDTNMANIYWAGAKAPKEETVKALMKELAECTNNRYYVKFESDGTGAHVCAYVETEHTKDTTKFKWNKRLPPKFMGWRLVVVFVPRTYIDIILLSKERDDA